ncbi:MAG: hypothetical protein ACRCYU_12515 [Nocardioides sp.]
MIDDCVVVRPEALRAMAASCAGAEDCCDVSARMIDAATLGPDTFGGTTHAGLISDMVDRFRMGVRDRLRSSAEDARFQAGSLTAAALDYEETDHCAAHEFRRLTGLIAPAEAGEIPHDGLMRPMRPTP